MHVLAAIYPFSKTGPAHLLVPVTEQLIWMTMIIVSSSCVKSAKTDGLIIVKIDVYVLSKHEHGRFHKISDIAELFLGKVIIL